jgi:hypothetical protein
LEEEAAESFWLVEVEAFSLLAPPMAHTLPTVAVIPWLAVWTPPSFASSSAAASLALPSLMARSAAAEEGWASSPQVEDGS